MASALQIVFGGLFGVLMVVLGQFLVKLLIEPLHELRKEIGQVRYVLMYHTATLHTPIGRNCKNTTEAKHDILACSAGLIAKRQGVVSYSKLHSYARLPDKRDIDRAAVLLRGLSTYVVELKPRDVSKHIDAVRAHVEEIEKLLRLDRIPE